MPDSTFINKEWYFTVLNLFSMLKTDMEKVDFCPWTSFWGWKMSTNSKSSYAYKSAINSNFFLDINFFCNKTGVIVDNNAELMGTNYKQIGVCPKMSTIFSKIVRKQCLHACDFFHVCPKRPPWYQGRSLSIFMSL